MADSDSFLKAWVWKREGKPDRVKYKKPYTLDHAGSTLTLGQAKTDIGTTVWDGSIVMARYLEHASLTAGSGVDLKGKRVLELGSGSQALPGMMAALLGATHVTVTDSGERVIDLLQKNIDNNTDPNGPLKKGQMSAKDYWWGKDTETVLGSEKFDVTLCAECMYVDEAIEPLLDVIDCVTADRGLILFTYGRNRRSEPLFRQGCAARGWSITLVKTSELHPEYVADDIDTLIVTRPDAEGGCVGAGAGEDDNEGAKKRLSVGHDSRSVTSKRTKRG